MEESREGGREERMRLAIQEGNDCLTYAQTSWIAGTGTGLEHTASSEHRC